MVDGHRIAERCDAEKFWNAHLRTLGRERLQLTRHSLFRFSDEQRERFSMEDLLELFHHAVPRLVGLQKNGNYVLYYDEGVLMEESLNTGEYWKIIIERPARDVWVITLYKADVMPR